MTDDTCDLTHYRYAVAWSREDGEYVATVAEFPSLSWLDPDQLAAIRGLEHLLATVIEDLRVNEEPIPEAFSDRSYSGRLNLRVSEELHRRLATEALAQQTSLNSYATALLEKRTSA